jgi:hypothetical protein
VWGFGEHGRLGLGDEERRLGPTLLPPEHFSGAKAAILKSSLYCILKSPLFSKGVLKSPLLF